MGKVMKYFDIKVAWFFSKCPKIKCSWLCSCGKCPTVLPSSVDAGLGWFVYHGELCGTRIAAMDFDMSRK